MVMVVTGCSAGGSSGDSEYYLESVCPAEVALTNYQTALAAQNLAEATTNAGLLATALENSIERLGAEEIAWAEGIDPADIATLHDGYARDLTKLQALAAPGTIGDKPFIFDYPGSDAATKRIHETFQLPRVLAEACAATA